MALNGEMEKYPPYDAIHEFVRKQGSASVPFRTRAHTHTHTRTAKSMTSSRNFHDGRMKGRMPYSIDYFAQFLETSLKV